MLFEPTRHNARLRRHLFTAASALSLLICLAIVALWARSYWSSDVLMGEYCSPVRLDPAREISPDFEPYVIDGYTFNVFYSQDGCFTWQREFASNLRQGNPQQYPSMWKWQFSRRWQRIPRNPLTFDFRRLTSGDRSELSVTVPYWAIAATAAVLPIIWLRRFRRARRAANVGRCRKCGYDLRASAERCPECGTLIATQEEIDAPPLDSVKSVTTFLQRK